MTKWQNSLHSSLELLLSYLLLWTHLNLHPGASLVALWLRIHLPMQETLNAGEFSP